MYKNSNKYKEEIIENAKTGLATKEQAKEVTEKDSRLDNDIYALKRLNNKKFFSCGRKYPHN